MSEGKNGNKASNVHSSGRICRVCAANVSYTGTIGTGWLVAYNDAAQKGDFETAQDLIDEAQAALNYGKACRAAASRNCTEANHAQEARVYGEGIARG